MLDLAACSSKFGIQSIEDQVICFRVIDLLPSAFSSGIDTTESNPSTQTHVQIPRSFLHVRSRSLPHDPAGVIRSSLIDIGVLQLAWICPC